MAGTTAEVVAFLEDLAKRSRGIARSQLKELEALAGRKLEAWDLMYFGEKLKTEKFQISDETLKNWFPVEKVLEGMFGIAERLYGITLSQRESVDTWHPDVRYVDVLDKQGQPAGGLFMDLYARKKKRGGAWMDDVRARWLRPDTGQLQTPVAHLVCNFADGVDGNPPLLTHDDVITLFHEFGHGLHHMLTQVNERDVSGISGVEWDAVELPSQFMENFCWEWDVLKHMTAHVDTGEPLPRALFDKMTAAKNFQSGMQTLRQVEFSLFDMRLHCEGEKAQNFMQILQEVRDEVSVLQPPAWSRTPHTFSHIFAGGYAAGYYSYKWAEVLSADAYAAFAMKWIGQGATIVGGCCEVGPAHIAKMAETITAAGHRIVAP